MVKILKGFGWTLTIMIYGLLAYCGGWLLGLYFGLNS
jgi:hypothetical protein